MQSALDLLILSLVVQEEAGLQKPPTIRSTARAARADAILQHAAGAWAADAAPVRGWRLRFVYLRLVLGLRHLTGTLWTAPLAAWRAARERTHGHTARMREVASYATSSPRESQVLRISILLRMMGQRAAAARMLVRRAQSGLSSPWCTHFLTLLLAETGQVTASPAMAGTELPGQASAAAYVPRRLRYGVVVTTACDTDVFRASVQSLRNSDFTGAIVVVEDGAAEAGTEPRACEDVCRALGVTYVSNPAREGSAAAVNLGIRHLPQETDIVLSCRSDVLWPGEWLVDLDRAWERVWDSDKVSQLNLSYLQCTGWDDASLKELFRRGRYEDLVWVLRSMREIPRLMDRVQAVQARPGESPFGLGRDPGTDWTAGLRQMTGRYSVAASFPLHVWREMGGFDPDLAGAIDLQMLHHNLTARRWALFVGNAPLLHFRAPGAAAIAPGETAGAFHRTSGWHLDHFLNIYFSESTVVHRDAILRAVNGGCFGEVDFVFDDFRHRLGVRTLANCELTWCGSHAQCPYTSVPV
ncbi:MAG: hypothetical protein Q7J25_05810 [Vicinamibacterales bacterium]|nr:hypothetical protein [Vicinamibacterales bacterium]